MLRQLYNCQKIQFPRNIFVGNLKLVNFLVNTCELFQFFDSLYLTFLLLAETILFCCRSYPLFLLMKWTWSVFPFAWKYDGINYDKKLEQSRTTLNKQLTLKLWFEYSYFNDVILQLYLEIFKKAFISLHICCINNSLHFSMALGSRYITWFHAL